MEDSAFGDYCGYVFRGGYVEGWVFDADSVGGELFSGVVGDLDGGALLDGDVVSVGGGEIDGGPGGGDVEGDGIVAGEDGDAEGSDFVGDIAIGGDAIGADDDGGDFLLGHDGGGHVIADDGDGDVVGVEFVRGDACALEEGAGFIGIDVELETALPRADIDRGEGGAVLNGGQATGVAVGEARRI